MYRVIESYVEGDGLVIPRAYSTVMANEEGVRLLGAHLVIDPSFTEKLDQKTLVRPATGSAVGSD